MNCKHESRRLPLCNQKETVLTHMLPCSHQIYFEKIHPSIPMIHKYRYLAAMNL